MNTFQYYQIRCCVSFGGEYTMSYLGETSEVLPGLRAFTPSGSLAEAQAAAVKGMDILGYNGADRAGQDAVEGCFRDAEVFWTIYGIEPDGCSRAIGDFGSFEDAYEVLSMILAPIRAAADTLIDLLPYIYSADGLAVEEANGMACALEDICNQSSTEERL